MASYITLPKYNETYTASSGYNNYSPEGYIQMYSNTANKLPFWSSIIFSSEKDDSQIYFVLYDDSFIPAWRTIYNVSTSNRIIICGSAFSNTSFRAYYYNCGGYLSNDFTKGGLDGAGIVTVNGRDYYSYGFYRSTSSSLTSFNRALTGVYSSLTNCANIEEAVRITGVRPIDQLTYPITYRDTNAVHYGPTEGVPGDNVVVSYTFPDGYGIVNPSSDIYVTNNGVIIPSQYADGKLTFTMPDPS